jgi:gliding motility-associated-like protein
MRSNTINKKLLWLLFLTLGFLKAEASHILGGEINYTYVSGNTYKITLIIYGDCAGTPGAFQGLTTATPAVQVYNGVTLITTINLQPQAGSGVNVSPVCPDEINSTTCTPGGTLPGVKKFIYAANYTLNTTSANWKFRTTGDMANATLAGRSNSITNASLPASGSLMSLEATLNNLTSVNSSPTYTTIPTPFFCINKPQEYNQGAIDPNGDSLTFALVPGLDASTTPSTNVSYISPYTATAPLGCATGTYNFSSTTGQLGFTPNVTQDALIVSRVSEYRNGVLVGTSMREMTFIVLNNCNNNPPTGSISNVTNATLQSGTVVNVCTFNGVISFAINPTDPDGDNITVSSQGIPTGAVVTINSNGTPAPTLSFSWDITGVAPGAYVFFLTLGDDGCPLSSKQSIAYTVNVLPRPSFNFNLLNPASCTQKARFIVTPNGTDVPYTLTVSQGATTVQTLSNITGPVTDSLVGGTYDFTLAGANTCTKDTTIDLGFLSVLTPAVSITKPTCPGSSTGTVSISATGNHPSFVFAFGTGAYATTNTFTGLAAGTYVLHVKDSFGCIKDTSVTVIDPPSMAFTLGIKKPVCTPVSNGQITVGITNGTAPYQYAINTGAFSTNNTFTALAPGTQVLHVKDANNCLKDTTITLTDSMQMVLTPVITAIKCYGNANGIVTINASGTTAPYAYALGTGVASSSNTFSNLGQGTYLFHVSDQNGCLKDTSIALVQPTPLAFTVSITNVLCFGDNSGSITVNASGGTPAYQYAADGNAFQSTNVLSELSAGSHVIHLKDVNNCLKDTTVNITQPATAVHFGNFALVAPTCQGFTDGSAGVTAHGGTAPYQFSFNNQTFGSTGSFTGIAEGTYIIKAKDNNGCTIDTLITFIGYPHITLDGVTMKMPTCNGRSDGQITLNVSGGLPPFTYQINQSGSWSNSPLFTGNAAGAYTLSVKDNNGCTKDTVVTLGEPDKIVVDTASVGNDCNGVDNGGLINISVTGGTAPFQYNWLEKPNLHTAQIVGLVNGSYTVNVVDANGCTGSATVEILYNNCCTPFIPNAFSPNGDGKNDNYKVEYKGDMDLKEMYIYNRFGQRVFSSSNVNKSWDGTFNGEKMDVGTYFYYIRILCGNRLKKELIFKGDVTLIR